MGSIGRDTNVHVVVAAIPHYGHTRPLRSLAKGLAQAGYPVSFLSGIKFKDSIEAIPGVEYVQLLDKADFNLDNINQEYPQRLTYGDDPFARQCYDLETFFIGQLPDQYKTLANVLKRPELQDKKVVILTDSTFTGVGPIIWEARDSRRVPVIGVGIMPLLTSSVDTAPFGMGLPPQGKEKNMELNAIVADKFSGPTALHKQILAQFECAIPPPHDYIIDNMCKCYDAYVQLSPPQLEFPRSDLGNVRFVGGITGGNTGAATPEWWQSFIVDEEKNPADQRRPLIVVTSGTVSSDAKELIIPTFEATKDLGVRVVACTVVAAFPEGYTVPEHVRTAEWIPFDELFSHADLVVSNGGWGGVNQAFAAGVPMVIAGTFEEKTETSARAANTGAAVNLQTHYPTVEQVRDAVQKVLGDKTFKSKAMGLKEVYASMDTVGNVREVVEEMAGKFYHK